MRAILGDGYVEALRGVWSAIPESVDLVMYWWNMAAEAVRSGATRRFGLITTNSLRQTYNRRVVQLHQNETPPLALSFVIPDHPWVDSADGAAVRIAMSVGRLGDEEGRLLVVIKETPTENGEVAILLDEHRGLINSDLSLGANLASSATLRANAGLTSRGVMLFGSGFIVTEQESASLGSPAIIRDYRNGRDLTDKPRGVKVIDAFGLDSGQLRSNFPSVYQWLLERVKPERDTNRDVAIRENWWLHGRTRGEIRRALAGLSRYIATVETAKHRTFQFLDASVLPDNKLIAIALDDAFYLGVLSSAVHGQWALAAGGWLGVGNDPVYVKTRCFETFPFPDRELAARLGLIDRIRQLAEQIDRHRKVQLASVAGLTLTGIYNVLEKLRDGTPLTSKERIINTNGLVAVLQSYHEELDAAVLASYEWTDLSLPADIGKLLDRLLALNVRRSQEEASGNVQWLRPTFQNSQSVDTQHALAVGTEPPEDALAPKTAKLSNRMWPSGIAEQIKSVAGAISGSRQPMTLDAITKSFSGKGRWKERVPMILDTLESLGRIRRIGDHSWSDSLGSGGLGSGPKPAPAE